MIVEIEAQEAWWPPTLRPDSLGRTRLAWWMIDVDSQSTRRWISSRTADCECTVASVWRGVWGR